MKKSLFVWAAGLMALAVCSNKPDKVNVVIDRLSATVATRETKAVKKRVKD